MEVWYEANIDRRRQRLDTSGRAKFNNEDVTLTNGQVAGEFYIQGPQAIVGDGTDSDWEEESVQAIKDMLSEDNRTSI